MIYSSLDHSIAVALIVWRFTHDKKQTFAGLFHDISTPAFKHCVDFMNGDYLKQESTEGLTTDFIKKSHIPITNLRDAHFNLPVKQNLLYHISYYTKICYNHTNNNRYYRLVMNLKIGVLKF